MGVYFADTGSVDVSLRPAETASKCSVAFSRVLIRFTVVFWRRVKIGTYELGCAGPSVPRAPPPAEPQHRPQMCLPRIISGPSECRKPVPNITCKLMVA